MKIPARCIHVGLLLFFFFTGSPSISASLASDVGLSSITVEDLVRFGGFGDPGAMIGNEFPREAINPSPDGKHIAVVVRQGNLARRTNDAKLLVYEASAELLSNPRVLTIAEFSSATNDQPIALVKWLPDSQTIFFAATAGKDPSQVYRFSLASRRLDQVTNETSKLVSYEVSQTGDRLVTVRFAQQRPPSDDPDCKRRGCMVDADTLQTAIAGLPRSFNRFTVHDMRRGKSWVLPAPELADREIKNCRTPAFLGGVSPDGRFALRACELHVWPTWWSEYAAPPMANVHWRVKNPLYALRLVLIDLDVGSASAVTDAPAVFGAPEPIWIDNGRYAIFPGAFESLNDVEQPERHLNASLWSVLLLDVSQNKMVRVSRHDPRVTAITLARWNQTQEVLSVQTADAQGFERVVRFRRRHGLWTRTHSPKSESATSDTFGSRKQSRFGIVVEQSPNSRPVLVATERGTGRRHLLLDPNPWLATRKLGLVKAVTWKAKDGRIWSGGLYHPPDYKEGARYPLVLQAYAFRPWKFAMRGFTQNFLGQALAAHGVVVLDVHSINLDDVDNTPAVWSIAQAGYEGAIDYLDELGMVDRTRVGIQGFSYTGPQVGYTLTHSNYDFAAAAFTSTADYGWWYYFSMGCDPYFDSMYGASPFGEGLSNWTHYSPSFNLDRVDAPMFMWAEANIALLWDWYAGLKRLGKPVEYWFLPDGTHDLFKVDEQLQMNNLLLDWYRFWLKGELDSDSSKSSQYERWQRLRDGSQSTQLEHEARPVR